MAEEATRWGDRLPGEANDLFAWCLDQPQDVLLDLLAFVAALTVDVVRQRHHPGSGLDHAERLADALALDMGRWWTPSVDGFFTRLPKSTLMAAVAEAEVPSPGISLASLPKAEAARRAADMLTGSGWLPAPLRPTMHTPALAA